jgi:hypothetical protein
VLTAVAVVFVASSVNPAAGWFTELARPWNIPGERNRAGMVVLILAVLPVLITGVTTTMRRRTAVPTTASPILPAQRDSVRTGFDQLNRPHDTPPSLTVAPR